MQRPRWRQAGRPQAVGGRMVVVDWAVPKAQYAAAAAPSQGVRPPRATARSQAPCLGRGRDLRALTLSAPAADADAAAGGEEGGAAEAAADAGGEAGLDADRAGAEQAQGSEKRMLQSVVDQFIQGGEVRRPGYARRAELVLSLASLVLDALPCADGLSWWRQAPQPAARPAPRAPRAASAPAATAGPAAKAAGGAEAGLESGKQPGGAVAAHRGASAATVFVRGLPLDASQFALQDCMARFGRVKACRRAAHAELYVCTWSCARALTAARSERQAGAGWAHARGQGHGLCGV